MSTVKAYREGHGDGLESGYSAGQNAALATMCEFFVSLGFSTGHADDLEAVLSEVRPQIEELRK